MNRNSLLQAAARLGALAAIPLLLAVPVSAQTYVQRSAPVVYSGLDCTRCAPGATFCVVNPIRFEYTCAPQGTYACAGISRTGFCPYGTMCWDGHCR
jgi:hypothetical protein